MMLKMGGMGGRKMMMRGDGGREEEREGQRREEKRREKKKSEERVHAQRASEQKQGSFVQLDNCSIQMSCQDRHSVCVDYNSPPLPRPISPPLVLSLTVVRLAPPMLSPFYCRLFGKDGMCALD